MKFSKHFKPDENLIVRVKSNWKQVCWNCSDVDCCSGLACGVSVGKTSSFSQIQRYR